MEQIKAFIAGGAGGAACVTVGFPFDTLKVRMQSAEVGVYTGFMDVAKKSIKRDGIAALYKGLAAPLIAQPPMFAFYFWGFNIGNQISSVVPGLTVQMEPLIFIHQQFYFQVHSLQFRGH